MSTTLDRFRLDQQLSSEGTWVDFQGGVRFKIARAGAPESSVVLRELSLRHLSETSPKTTEALQRVINREWAAKALLRDWDGVFDKDGKPMPYTPDRGVEVFNDPELGHLYDFVIRVAHESSFFRVRRIEESKGN